jgi:hypothetical protein
LLDGLAVLACIVVVAVRELAEVHPAVLTLPRPHEVIVVLQVVLANMLRCETRAEEPLSAHNSDGFVDAYCFWEGILAHCQAREHL